jgi:lipoyl(octanoyl) transferase
VADTPGGIVDPIVRPWAAYQVPYLKSLQAMRDFNAQRTPETPDEIWLVEHPPVFTMGLAAKAEHLLNPGDIPVVPTERGGQVTYHGPGQILMYVMLDLRRWGITVRDLVCRLERAAINTLAHYGIAAMGRRDAPGVYLNTAAPSDPSNPADPPVPGAKIAALGLKVARGCTFHGLALNVAMDLEPFDRINPCGYPGLQVTDMQTCLSLTPVMSDVAQNLAHHLIAELRHPTC